MPALQFPKTAISLLDKAQINVADSYEDKWLIYNIAPGCNQDDNWELFETAVRNNGGFTPEDDELEELGWCWSAETHGHELKTLQDVLDFHFGIISRRIAGEPTGQKHFTYEFGFVVIANSEWRDRGVIAVHLDRDRGKWKVTRCCLPLDRLGVDLTSVWDFDMTFHDVRRELQDTEENMRIYSEDTHADNQGGPVPEGAWQFSMYSTVKPMRQVQDSIPDPRDDFFGPGEECFAAIAEQMSTEEVIEHFPLSYSQFFKAQATLESSKKTVIRRHPELFVIIDSETPGERGVLIVRLSWDKDVDKSESKLRRSGQEGRCVTQRCDVDSLVTTLECMAGGRGEDDV